MPAAYDVLIITTDGCNRSPWKIRQADPAFQGDLDLDGTVALRRLGGEVATAVIDACSLRGLGRHRSSREGEEQVSIVRENPPEPDQRVWDSDRAIREVLALCRLVRPIPVGLRYAARIWLSNHGAVSDIKLRGGFRDMDDAFCPRGQRLYLTERDAQEIKTVLALQTRAQLPKRVKSARWRFEYAFYERYVDFRWMYMSLVAEALVHTDLYTSTAQFSRRLEKIAAQIGVRGWTAKSLRRLYSNYRSAVAHGQDITVVPASQIPEYLQFENLMRQVLLRCITDKRFCALFRSAKTIRRTWPI